MIQYLTAQVVAVINALGGPVFTLSLAGGFTVWSVGRRITINHTRDASIKHEEAVVAEANRHSEKLALIKSNDPKMVEGMNKQLASD